MTSKKIGITHPNHSALLKAHSDKKCTCNVNVYIFNLHFTLDIIPGYRCDRKNTENYFIQVKPLSSVVEFSNTVTF